MNSFSSNKKGLFNSSVIVYVIGTLLLLNGSLMLSCVPFAIYYDDQNHINTFLLCSLITISFGFLLRFLTKDEKNAEIKKRDGYLIVVSGWLCMTFFGTLPYLLTDSIPSFTDAFFETMSGFTTTGSTILDEIESLPKSILFWRSMTQWIGGMGIIVLTIAILPLLGIGGMELFVAEAPGPTKDKIHPRIKETAKRLWIIYFSLTALETVVLMFFGLSFFDAINHSLTTTSTGGFSTKQESIAAFQNPFVEAVIVIFMFLAGTNFTMIYFGLKMKFRKIVNNDEFKWYLSAVFVLILLLSFYRTHTSSSDFIHAFREISFQVVSIITTTGYATADYTLWGSFLTFIFFLFLFSGASAGSTSGGIKIVRIILLIKNGLLEFKRRLHPKAVIPVMLNKQVISSTITYNLLAFIFLYLFVFTLGSIFLSFLGVDMLTSISAVASAVGNVGPGIADVGPSSSFSQLPTSAKWILSLLMLMGRLELFTVCVLFTPYFWKRN
ncbi:MAG: TrkH family potassium uptake protein [Bacteroidota bacterium]|nr:TrkH family potassium uptake protein [Bacteroidota bacterium]MEC7998563.1 TrkH family potassium uptake protein [Bacteroidota bacterium]MEC8286548.1 TrkH family potassium uptake protein [Bacteroidota bacterium]MEC8408142.1 TrkH family potassium uptake protein [Bacteroidota bacterium]